jgi:sulfur-oxidizing protein SoxX
MTRLLISRITSAAGDTPLPSLPGRPLLSLCLALSPLLLSSCAVDAKPEPDLSARTAQVLRNSFTARGIAGMDRLDQDPVQQTCTEYTEKPMPPAVADNITRSQLATIRKPASGKLIGDWRAGEKLAQEGRGLQFSDAADGPRGGNCYACHQLAPQEISYGNLGPSLAKYGALRGNSAAVVEYTYGKIFNAQAYAACTNMPRFGARQILTPEQIADLTALLLDPESPVNR